MTTMTWLAAISRTTALRTDGMQPKGSDHLIPFLVAMALLAASTVVSVLISGTMR